MRKTLRSWRLRWSASLRKPFQRRALTTAEIGELGEWLAARWLRRQKRKVLYRNFKAPEGGEVDIVCRHGNNLVFTEVKTRTSVGQYRPADAVNAEKRLLIQRGAREWLRLLGRTQVPIRFDIVEVVLREGQPPEINVIEQAFQLPRGSMLGRV